MLTRSMTKKMAKKVAKKLKDEAQRSRRYRDKRKEYYKSIELKLVELQEQVSMLKIQNDLLLSVLNLKELPLL